MDEEVGVKVTRLRRRLSVEAESTQSPATPSTPTKKRGGRLAKPALELIDENMTENAPKRATRKSVVGDAVEPVEEKTVTPSRRSARIRSNTSLVLEVTQNVVESPRARRATRRNSQIGSDTETTITTPARATRRTRKDSTSSVEKLAISNIEKPTVQVTEVINEEPERENFNDVKLEQTPPLRKSPRLNKKGEKGNNEVTNDINETPKEKDKSLNNVSKLTDEIGPTDDSNTSDKLNNNKSNNSFKSKDAEKKNLSITSAKLIDEIEVNPKKSDVLSKTSTEIEGLVNEKTNRKRTKSWTTITSQATTENDSQNKSGFGDSLLKNNIISNSSIENKENINVLKSMDVLDASETQKFLEKTPSKIIQSVVYMEDSDSNSGSIGKLTIDLQNDEDNHNNRGDQCVPVVEQPTPKRTVSESFTVEPMDIDETIPANVTINDFSDKTNSSREEDKVPNMKRKSSISDEKINTSEHTNKSTLLQNESDNSEQKIADNTFERNNDESKVNENDKSHNENKSKKKMSLSKCDIENDKRQSSVSSLVEDNKSKRKSSLSKDDIENDRRRSSVSFPVERNESINKSKNRSMSEKDTQRLEKSSNENKSTLVLSQLKDVSANEMNNVSKSLNDTNNELSKSVNIVPKETDKKNVSLNLLTSTPLQQKPQKLAMQINTSVISSYAAHKNISQVNKTKSPMKKVSNDSDNSDSSDEDSIDKSKMIDDEAEEASDDYESGDSRNEEEKQYEREHEIQEKDETLESEPEFSDDSDYEKDSFIVSSDEEDDELLSGSGDDLSLSDNELKMTAKSKKKYDERKQKEQKKASKEMYKARHNLDESDKSLKSKKHKRQRLDSSLLESEKEETFPKNKNRQRIDSSQDVCFNNSDADVTNRPVKKKVKQLSECVFEGNGESNEKEITICNQSVVEKDDPLSVAIKIEPKTPQKQLNISTVLVNDNIEEVQVDSNVSFMKTNETTDPLQATLAQEKESSDSDNMEIKENYDSILETLNKVNNKQKKIKMQDTSLNLNKKTKVKATDPEIVDQLNLTKVKKSKKNKVHVVKENGTAEELEISQNNEEGEISDSIDMRLLFPEDSNDSETNSSKFKPDQKQDIKPAEPFIPLKRTEAKTNIRESLDLNISKNESELNVSKKKKRKSSKCIPEDELQNTNINFFIDTVGTHEAVDISIQNSDKKNKKKRKQSLSLEEQNVVEASGNVTAELEKGLLNYSQKSDKKKKKKNKSFDVHQTEIEETSANVSMGSDKKIKQAVSVDVNQVVEEAALNETPANVSMNSDKKKKKKKNKSFDTYETADNMDEPSVDVLYETKKNKSNVADSEETTENSAKKKKKNKALETSQIADNAVPGETTANVSLENEKKKKKKNKSHDVSQTVNNTGDESDEAPVEVSSKVEKYDMNVPEPDDDAVPETKNKFKKKKKKKNKSAPQLESDTQETEVKAKKRSHDMISAHTTLGADDEIIISKAQKKKRKISQIDDKPPAEDGTLRKPKKRKASMEDENSQKKSKVLKENSFDKIHVPRLPESIVNQLDDKIPKESLNQKKIMPISTMPFVVEEVKKRKNKPSNYLEQSIYLNDSPVKQKQKSSIKNPKVLPFTPTAITSGKGYTSQFRINVLPTETEFVAQASNIANFKSDYLSKQRIKKLGTIKNIKRQRNHKLSKF